MADKADGGTSITRPLRAPADGNTSAIFDRRNTAYVGSTVDFFDDGGTDRAVAEQTNGTTARVYADSNCTMGADLAVQIIGNVLANLQHERLYLLILIGRAVAPRVANLRPKYGRIVHARAEAKLNSAEFAVVQGHPQRANLRRHDAIDGRCGASGDQVLRTVCRTELAPE